MSLYFRSNLLFTSPLYILILPCLPLSFWCQVHSNEFNNLCVLEEARSPYNQGGRDVNKLV